MDKSKPTVPFGHATKNAYFSFAENYTPLNHGSYGAFPKPVRNLQRQLQELTEARPDTFLRYTYPDLLHKSRNAVAPLLGVSADEVVFVPNATTAVNTVLRNLAYQEGDVILYFSTIFEGCKRTIQFLCESAHVQGVCISIDLPAEDEYIVGKFNSVVQDLKNQGKVIKLAMFDTVLTFPGVRFPWESLVKACKGQQILSCIDGAHGIGHIDLTHLGEIAPDFFTSNCYKWLFVPIGSAVLYVPRRNQHLIRSTIPISLGFQPHQQKSSDLQDTKAFSELFKKVSTVDISPYICVQEALNFREQTCGGEEKIRKYCENLAQTGGKRMAEILGTEVMENRTGTLQKCCFATVLLPFIITEGAASYDSPTVSTQENGEISFQAASNVIFIRGTDVSKILNWLTDKSVKEYETMIPIKVHAGRIWCRISGQIYLELKDFEWAGYKLKELCDRVSKGEFKATADK